MAMKSVKKTVEVIVCDVDGCKNEEATPLPWNINGTTFDVCAVHRSAVVTQNSARPSLTPKQVKAIREWANPKPPVWKANIDYPESGKGRISDKTRAAAHKAGII